MAITRRQFLTRTGLGAGGLMLAPNLFGHPFVRQAFANIGAKYLVVFYLDGGNDGQNTIVPYDNGGAPTGLRSFYSQHRKTGNGGIQLAPGSLLVPSGGGVPPFVDANTGVQLGFHPGLVGIRNLYLDGKVAVVQGCGYPDYSLSHDTSTTIWRTANPTGNGTLAGTGWVGRHLAATYTPSQVPAVAIGSAVPGEFRQTSTSVLTLRRVRTFGFPYDDFDETDESAKRDVFAETYGAAAASPNATLAYLGNAGSATLLASESYPPLYQVYTNARQSWFDDYSALGTTTGRAFREIAQIVYGVHTNQPNIEAHFFQARQGGYDTHADQGLGTAGERQYDLFREFGDAVELFYRDMEDIGIASDVCIVVWSEFSRRIPQNANGTDHGSQGPMFVIGGSVAGGVYGRHPNIDPAALDDEENTPYAQGAAAFRSTDFRDVFGTILKHWLAIPQTTILSSILPLDAGDPSKYWTVANLDMGFLP
jgi:uncharacterized protein (DUF1501 family)